MENLDYLSVALFWQNASFLLLDDNVISLVAAAEDDEGDLAVAEHRQLVSFFHHAKFSLVESHLHKTNLTNEFWMFFAESDPTQAARHLHL